jgi:hypothetical protein
MFDVSEQGILIAIMIQGATTGLLLTPIQELAFVTLAPSMATDGVALFRALRNSGAAISVPVAVAVFPASDKAWAVSG